MYILPRTPFGKAPSGKILYADPLWQSPFESIFHRRGGKTIKNDRRPPWGTALAMYFRPLEGLSEVLADCFFAVS
jgi:hypothetical protein